MLRFRIVPPSFFFFFFCVGTVAVVGRSRKLFQELINSNDHTNSDGFGVAVGPIPVELSGLQLLTKMILAQNQLAGERAPFLLDQQKVQEYFVVCFDYSDGYAPPPSNNHAALFLGHALPPFVVGKGRSLASSASWHPCRSWTSATTNLQARILIEMPATGSLLENTVCASPSWLAYPILPTLGTL